MLKSVTLPLFLSVVAVILAGVALQRTFQNPTVHVSLPPTQRQAVATCEQLSPVPPVATTTVESPVVPRRAAMLPAKQRSAPPEEVPAPAPAESTIPDSDYKLEPP